MSNSTKIIFIAGILLLIYGYLCRLLNIYFFWDSKHFGWIMLVTALLGFFIDLKKILEAQKKTPFIAQFFIGIIIVLLGIAGGGVLLLNSSKAYQDLVETIKTDELLKNEIGTIKGTGLFPTGMGFMDYAYGLSYGPSTFSVTVRGSRAIKDVEITLYKSLPVE